MRTVGIFALLLAFASCGPSAVLYTDELFQAAAPEVTQAWRALRPWKDARWRPLPPGSSLAALEADLKDQGAESPGPVLVGMALSSGDRRTLTEAFPGHRFFFFTPDAGDDGIFVNRTDSWELVARTAAVRGGAATALFPTDSDQASRDRFSRAWRAAGGGPLTSWVWPGTGTLGSSGTVFQWVGPEADPKITVLSPAVAVHGDPGTARAPGAAGLTWGIRTDGLGDFLWRAAQSSGRKAHFLPLETVPASR